MGLKELEVTPDSSVAFDGSYGIRRMCQREFDGFGGRVSEKQGTLDTTVTRV